MDNEITRLVFLFCEFHQYLRLTQGEPLSQMVIWRKIFLPHLILESGLPSDSQLGSIDHYLLIVAMVSSFCLIIIFISLFIISCLIMRVF